MSGGEAPRGMVAPNFRTPRLVGIFSVVFATELLIVGVCMCGYVAVLPLFRRLIETSQVQFETQAASSRKSALNALAEQEKGAKTEEDRIAVAVRRHEIEARATNPMAGILEVNKVQMGDPSFLRFSWADATTGVALNALLLASGIGLLHWKPWALRLAVWTAALKLIRLVLLYGYFVVVVVPPYARRLGKAAEQMLAAGVMAGKSVPWMNGDFYVRMYTIMYTGFGLGVMVLGAVYPAVVLWCLTRPGARSACSGLWQLPKEPRQP